MNNDLNNIDNDNINNFYKEVIKIVNSFYKSANIVKYLKQDCEYQDFISFALLLLIQKDIYHNYDKSKGKLTTYIYSILYQNLYILMYQAKYNLDYNKAKTLYDNSRQKCTSIFLSKLSMYNCASLQTHFSDKDDFIESRDDASAFLLLEDNNSVSTEKYVEDKLILEKIIQLIDKTKIFTPKKKDMLFYFMKTGSSSETAKHYGCSRQNIYNLVARMRKYLKRKQKVIGYNYQK